MTKYGRSPWLDRFPASRVPAYPRYRGATTADVAIIGGGLTGCATAYAFAAAGVDVVLLEADRIGRGASAGSSGWIADDPGVSFVEVERAIGMRAARQSWQSWRRAGLDFMALIRRLDLKCHLEPRGSLTVAQTPEQFVQIKREHKTRRDAGLDASIVNARAVAGEVAVAVAGALRSRDGATIDPYRAAIGLAAAAAGRGARLFEKSGVVRTTFTRRSAAVNTSAGTIRVKRIIVATGSPTALFRSLQRHFWFRSSYLVLTERVPAAVRQRLGARTTILRDAVSPPHAVRWIDGEEMLISGADADVVPARQRGRAIVQRTGQLMYELSTIYPDISGIQPAYGWEVGYTRTAEGLPYVGPHRNFPHHLFAFGDASHSVTGAYLASRMFVRQFLDQAEPSDAAFSFTR